MTTQSLTLDQVKVGDALPELAYDVDVSTVVLGAMATRDWRPMHHDKDFAVERNGIRHVFMNTPNLSAWFERYMTDWSGPKGRLGRMKFRMMDSIFPGDRMVFSGTVSEVATDDAGCGWATVDVSLHVGEKVVNTCQVRIALPTGADDNPWTRSGDAWTP